MDFYPPNPPPPGKPVENQSWSSGGNSTVFGSLGKKWKKGQSNTFSGPGSGCYLKICSMFSRGIDVIVGITFTTSKLILIKMYDTTWNPSHSSSLFFSGDWATKPPFFFSGCIGRRPTGFGLGCRQEEPLEVLHVVKGPVETLPNKLD